MSATCRVIIAVAAGLAGGLAISASQDARLLSVAVFVEPVGKLWVNAIRMTAVPLVVSLLVISVASVAFDRSELRLAGIPSGSLIMAAPLYASFGLPVEGMRILIAVDFLPENFKTVANVTGGMTRSDDSRSRIIFRLTRR